MKKIGQGWQYTVYDLSEQRVLKKANSRFASFFIMLHDSFPYIKHPIWKFPAYYQRCQKDAFVSLEIIKKSNHSGWIFANPHFLDGCDYTQDKVTPIRKALRGISPEGGKKIVDDFVEFNKLLIELSVIDRNFNILDNFAINDDGKVILMDLGELYSDPKKINNYLMTRPWALGDVTNSLPGKLRDYFINKMDETFLK